MADDERYPVQYACDFVISGLGNRKESLNYAQAVMLINAISQALRLKRPYVMQSLANAYLYSTQEEDVILPKGNTSQVELIRCSRGHWFPKAEYDLCPMCNRKY